jgi:hypothetical protein
MACGCSSTQIPPVFSLSQALCTILYVLSCVVSLMAWCLGDLFCGICGRHDILTKLTPNFNPLRGEN